MPSKFRKSILSVGRHHSPDGVLDVTPDRLKHFADSFQRMTKAGAVIPISWDHATTMKGLVPMSAAAFKNPRSAKNTIGRLSNIELAADGSGAEITVEITDPTAQGRAERNEVFVSPVILDRWRDGKGEEWRDVITHVDLVNHPVDATQQPFSPVVEGALACALRLGLNTSVYRMATDEDDDKLDDELGADTDEDLDVTDDVGDDEPLDDATDIPPPPAEPANQPALEEVISALKALVGMLQALKPAAPAAPEETTEEPVDNELDTGVDANQPINTPDPGYLAMSTTATKQANAAFVYAQQQHREKIAGRLESLLANGQCSAEEYHARKKTTNAVRLSLSDDGRPVEGDLERWIASRENVPHGAFWDMSKRTTRLSVVAQPKGVNGELTSEEENSLVDFALGRKAKA